MPKAKVASTNGKKSDFHGGADFDDMIAQAIEQTTKKSGGGDAHDGIDEESAVNGEQSGKTVIVDSSLPFNDDKSMSESDHDAGDLNSLGSDDISGGSDVSDVEEQETNFVAVPLINDDESTIDMRPPAPVQNTVSSYVEALNRQQNQKSRIIKAGVFLILIAVIVGVVLAIVSVTGGGGGGSDKSGVEGTNYQSPDTVVRINTTISSSPSISPGIESIAPTVSSSETIMTPTLPPQTALPTKSITQQPVVVSITTEAPTLASTNGTETAAPSSSSAITDATTTFAPVSSAPVTSAPITNAPSTKRPTPQPTFAPVTPKPSANPTNRPTPRPTPPPVPAASSDTYFCASVSYTSNWNLLLDFDCEIRCPTMVHSACPGGYQCHVSDACRLIAGPL